ncbi:hypothetical protein ACET3Z_028478 [Daucus carota]
MLPGILPHHQAFRPGNFDLDRRVHFVSPDGKHIVVALLDCTVKAAEDYQKSLSRNNSRKWTVQAYTSVCQRGVCDFSTKAEVAQSGGASGMLVINSEADGLPVMDCPHTKTLNISIPSVVVTNGITTLCTCSSSAGYVTAIFMVYGCWTVTCASLWKGSTVCDKIEGSYSQLSLKESSETDEDDEEVVEINVMSAIVFVITASTFLLLLYYFMSSWFVWLLIVLFCIGGIQPY